MSEGDSIGDGGDDSGDDTGDSSGDGLSEDCIFAQVKHFSRNYNFRLSVFFESNKIEIIHVFDRSKIDDGIFRSHNHYP